jgi:hypothetical protein
MPRDWKAEYRRRRALANAILFENRAADYVASARAFVSGLSDQYQAALAAYIGVPRPALLDAFRSPAVLTRGVVSRLCLWGWNPYRH